MNVQQVKVWFQNRRMKMRHQEEQQKKRQQEDERRRHLAAGSEGAASNVRSHDADKQILSRTITAHVEQHSQSQAEQTGRQVKVEQQGLQVKAEQQVHAVKRNTQTIERNKKRD